MKKMLVIVLFSSFLFTSCGSGAAQKSYIMSDSVNQRDCKDSILPQD